MTSYTNVVSIDIVYKYRASTLVARGYKKDVRMNIVKFKKHILYLRVPPDSNQHTYINAVRINIANKSKLYSLQARGRQFRSDLMQK